MKLAVGPANRLVHKQEHKKSLNYADATQPGNGSLAFFGCGLGHKLHFYEVGHRSDFAIASCPGAGSYGPPSHHGLGGSQKAVTA